MDLVRPSPDPDRQDLVPEEAVAVALDLHVVALPDYSSSDEGDQGEYGVGRPRPPSRSSDEESGSDEFWSSDEEWSYMSADSGYETLSEEEEEEERVEETEDEEEEEEREEEMPFHHLRIPWLEVPARAVEPEARAPSPVLDFIPLIGCRHNRDEEEVRNDGRWVGSTAQAVEPEARAPSPSPQQRAQRPGLAIRALLSAAHSSAPRPLPMGSALDFIPLSEGKRVRDEDIEDEEVPSSKRPCLSSSNPRPSTSDPGLSTSSGTSGGIRFHFHQQLHLHQDSESDED
ncbi:histone H3.v1-like [Boleophthalmus pectinirostris]|uniref:histone H3.v1-like n=1 Tax=Boleophthalmus pectinirostris TaxID=150288 RepID=UPI00242CC263|nr:histone H3.v1-like [Boleophthalmus pectinirostris]XP_055003837.1 histone H3.v1-like [Boleophthalmus pectinirostris]